MSKHSNRRRSASRNGRQRNLTPVVILGSALIVVIAGLWFAMSRSTASQPTVPVIVNGSPRLQIDQELIDFGQVPVGKMVKASFVLSNTGDQALTISHPPVPEVLEGC